MPQTTIYSESFNIRASEVDNDSDITIAAICELFQEVAGNHALQLNFDITDLHKKGLTWVLHRMDIQVKSFPKWRQKVTIETWPAAGDGLRAYRNYRILDEDQNELVVCLSYWMMINLKTRRPTRMTEEILNTRFSDRDHTLPIKSSKISKLTNVDASKRIVVRKSDLDMNQHVNNARYMEWLIEALPASYNQKPRGVDIVFLRESIYGDTLTSSVQQQEKHTLHTLVNQKDEIVAQAEFYY